MDYRSLIEKYNLRLDIPPVLAERACYLAPEQIEIFILDLLISQNQDAFGRFLDKIKDKIDGKLMAKASGRLGLGKISSPDVYLLNRGIEEKYHFVYTEHSSLIGLSHKAVLKCIGDEDDHPLMHELAHYIMYTLNKQAMMDDIKGKSENHSFFGALGKGLFLERNRFQMEGFAEWLPGESKYQGDYRKLVEGVGKISDKWTLKKFLRREFDNPYSLGLMVYNLVEETDGIEGVKDLTFARSVDRLGMLEKYRDSCIHLGLRILECSPRRRRLAETYEEMVDYGATGRNRELEDVVRHIDSEIEKLELDGKEPKILYYANGISPMLDVVAESFWHHGVFLPQNFSDQFTLKQKRSMNIISGFSCNVYDKIFDSDWNLFIDDGGAVFRREIEDSCTHRNITYIRTGI